MSGKKNWSFDVTKNSISLDLEEGVFTWDDPKKIAKSLKFSAENSVRKKARTAFQSAMSMLNFYINRAGSKPDPKQKHILEQAKLELRKVFCKT
ncbi:hypothetical protein A2962_02010 [Candidatus Woesebacteria bacterium RIFCSPLOWO2_01_FULL_39_61]|uniref:DUF3175 domain-containing protein n=1 Tax=Candidatus Woesebacteria bacterium RIFCSPHIGHO2_02_FULL_39_13 TaxID=1802505 RepID=A0A1F7Z1G8_9BACT|nr:MAG: hypothetical protein A2692_02730 [Candidatus Woesebacteria bacterium RIFCSPHIGHO2_01_FULL_39_95]OGM33284.1 MAG: hypothetical protein A3D01_00650 [Candidatus Woesebacteria bacterium RIFCSPHIGHO2_02_FULL_39_13]OGM38456.1 MAG: hypothetical protein A3E13_00530 [Candidatus Woesebacteria bacterium RIFCSPHIGHO2_12_FULL_40_20]OGM66894.1 MAG: hypothetical protein A2962_02010 [Candidatus Woesebacteria bacterium RIFCSPLOWO2_01_FULL_39_61]OGM75333.1 MAG: hypothetical protein A3H19_02910 [Candidatus